MRTRLIVSMLLLWFISCLPGCSGAQKLPPNGPQSPDAVLAKALAVPLARTLQGMSRLESYVDGEARKADVLLRVQAPHAAQFQALTPTLDLIAVLTTDGDRFSSFERGASHCYTGKACAANIARIVPIALPPEQMVEAVLGRPPLLSSKRRKLSWDADKNAYVVQIGPTLDGHSQKVWIRPRDYRFLASIIYRRGQRVASIAYGGHDKIAKLGPPEVMRMKVAANKTDMSLQLREVEINAEIEPGAFATGCPTGTVAVDLPCAATTQALPPPAGRSLP